MAHVVILFCALFLCTANCFDQGDDIVVTKYGPIRGLVSPNYRRFQGVPFATPPLGDLRWKKPVPPSPWTAVKDCRNFIIGCAQSGHSMDVPTNTSEDCLYLELWTPSVGKYQEEAAVMVWFYGGDFKEGGESFQLYNGSWIASNTNTIVIATNYRIGALGFLYSGATDHNVGIQDQRFTLQWVQDNIAAFGGDPNKVTIFGQSAGAASVLIHMASPQETHLIFLRSASSASHFHRAIAESAPVALTYKTPDAALLLAEVFAWHLGCSRTNLKCMQSKTTQEVLEAAGKSFIVPLDVGDAVMMWSPVVTGGDDFPQQPLDAFSSGQIVQVPLVIGSNSDDAVLFGWAISPHAPLAESEYVAIVAGIFHDLWIPTVLKYYPPADNGDNRDVVSQLLTDYLFKCPSRYVARLAESTNVNSTYLYQFSRVPPVCPWPKSQQYCCNRVCHGDEIPYVYFDNGNPYPWNFTGGDYSLAQAMATYWSSFAMFGNPNKYNSIRSEVSNKYSTAKNLYQSKDAYNNQLHASTPHSNNNDDNNDMIEWSMYTKSTDINMKFNWPLQEMSGLSQSYCDMLDKAGYDHVTAHKLASVLETVWKQH